MATISQATSNVVDAAKGALGVENTKTIAVLDESELKDGQMKEVDFGNGKVLVSKIGGRLHATSAFCTHYGAPLAKGVLASSGRVTCPWHGACFNVCTGDIEDAPAPAGIHRFEARVESGRIVVTADPSQTTKDNMARAPPVTVSSSSVRKAEGAGVVIVGGGSGALGTLLGLRESGYDGKVTVLSAEPHSVIDRTKLSKALLTDLSKLELYSGSDLSSKLGVDLRTSTQVSGVDTNAKTVSISGSSEKVSYDKLVLATGGAPKRLPIPGADLPNVFILRSLNDTKRIVDSISEGKKLVVVGSSFIGMEIVVAVGEKKLKSIDVIGMEKYPFQAVLGDKIGAALKKVHESKGVKFYPEAKTTKITEKAVTFEDASGSHDLEADIVVMAVGVAPATEFLKGSDIETQKDGSIEVDQYLKVKEVNDVYAIGDIATYPEQVTGQKTRIEHWNVAQNHGRAVASAIAGKALVFDKTPVFWSAQRGQLRYVGHAKDYDDVYIEGSPEELKFLAYYIKGDKVLAVAGMQRDPVPMHCAELLRLGRMPSASEIKSGKDPLSVDISTSSSHVTQ